MKSYKTLVEEVHKSYSDWHKAATEHPDFTRFASPGDIGQGAIGNAKNTVYAVGKDHKPLGVFSHTFNSGHFFEN